MFKMIKPAYYRKWCIDSSQCFAQW